MLSEDNSIELDQFKENAYMLSSLPSTFSKKEPILVNPDEVIIVNANSSGFFVPEIRLGKWIEKGVRIGKIICPINGNILEEIIANSGGLIFTLREYPMTYEGGIVARIAKKEN